MNRSQFVNLPDPQADKILLKAVSKINSINKDFFYIITACLEMNISEKHGFAIHNFLKIQLAVESCCFLIKGGYYGTANAMYRQIYEFVLWNRIALSVDDEELRKITEEFFSLNEDNSTTATDKEQKRKRDPINYISKNIHMEITKEIFNLSESFYSDLCAYTHASNRAQQYFFAEDSFYENSMHSITILATLLYMAIDVFDMFLAEVSSDIFTVESNCYTKDKGRYYLIDNLYAKISEEIDALLEKIDSEKKGGIPFLVIALRGKWSLKQKNDK